MFWLSLDGDFKGIACNLTIFSGFEVRYKWHLGRFRGVSEVCKCVTGNLRGFHEVFRGISGYSGGLSVGYRSFSGIRAQVHCRWSEGV